MDNLLLRMVILDGRKYEGGGGLLRTSLSFSAVSGVPFKIKNIRGNRSNSGLRAQHLNAVKAIEELCNAKVSEIKVGSDKLTFEPGEINSKTINVDIGTAGSTTLILQSILPAAIYSKKNIEVRITGGTNNIMAPPIDNLLLVFFPILKKFGAKIKGELKKRGYYPKGGGKILANINPSRMNKINLIERGKLIEINGFVNASEKLKNANVVEREIKALKSKLQHLNVPININKEYSKSDSVGNSISLCAKFEKTILGADSFGRRGKSSEKVGKECAQKLLKEINSDGCVDVHLTDQLIPYLAIWGGKIKVREISMHTKTNIWVAEKLLNAKFDVDENVIECKKPLIN